MCVCSVFFFFLESSQKGHKLHVEWALYMHDFEFVARFGQQVEWKISTATSVSTLKHTDTHPQAYSIKNQCQINAQKSPPIQCVKILQTLETKFCYFTVGQTSIIILKFDNILDDITSLNC